LPEIEAIPRLTILLNDVIPVKTGIQTHVVILRFLDSRFAPSPGLLRTSRGNDECNLCLVDSSVFCCVCGTWPDTVVMSAIGTTPWMDLNTMIAKATKLTFLQAMLV
jgi:hypothetical protein